MAEAKGPVRRVLLVKFKAETAPDHIEQLMKDYSNLVNVIESLTTWRMGKDVDIKNLHEGFTHVVELTFEANKGSAEYKVHPGYLELHERFWPQVEKAAVIEYRSTPFGPN